MKPRASRSADIVASVPDDTSRTISIDGSSRHSVSAISISISVGAPNDRPCGAACDDGAHDRRMRVAEDRRPPRADVVDVALAVGVPHVGALRRASKKRGVPPTERKARTGELTPAGIVRWARAKSSSLRLMAVVLAVGSEMRSRRGDARAAMRARRRVDVAARRTRAEITATRVGAGARPARAHWPR